MKYLLVLLVVVLFAWWVFRPRRTAAPPAAKPAPKAEAAPQAMLQCAHCGVHLPRAEAMVDERGAFCSEAHRLAGPGPGHG